MKEHARQGEGSHGWNTSWLSAPEASVAVEGRTAAGAAFVDALDLGDPPQGIMWSDRGEWRGRHHWERRRPSRDGEVVDDRGAVDGNAAVAFTDELSDERCLDVLNSLLLAQLVASSRVDREVDPAGWYAEYIAVLRTIGWAAPSMNWGRGRTGPERRMSMHRMTRQFGHEGRQRREGVAMEKVVTALGRLEPTDRRAMMFERWSHGTDSFNFQVGCVMHNERHKRLALVLLAVFGRAKESISDVIRSEIATAASDVSSCSTLLVLDEQVMIKARDVVAEKVAAHALDAIGLLDM